MVIILATVFIAAMILIARPRISRTPFVVFLLSGYFVLIRDAIDLFFTIQFPSLTVKFLVYILIVGLPVLLFIASSFVNGLRLAIALVFCFVSLLPLTRPTQQFLRSMVGLKLTFLEDRFLENLSQANPTREDALIFESFCESMSNRARTRFTAHLRGYQVPESSNACLKMARSWKGPIPHPNQGMRYTGQEWRARFASGTLEERIQVLDHLRFEKDPGLKEEAVAALNTNHDRLLIASVLYLQKISGRQIGYDPERWNQWLSSTSQQAFSSMFQPKSSPLVDRGFSAIKVMDDLLLSKEEGKDFLEVFLQKHFPVAVSEEDIELLRQACEEANRRPDSIAKFYKKGLMYFFLALSETSLLRSGHFQDPTTISNHWKVALENLQWSGMAGIEIAREVSEIIREADGDRNGSLNQQELNSILAKRSR